MKEETDEKSEECETAMKDSDEVEKS